MTPRPRHHAFVLFGLLSLLASASPIGADEGLDARLAEIAAVRLDITKAVSVQGLSLNTGMAVLKVEKGTFFPASPVGGRVTEAVFLGSARLVLEPPDEVEKAQLELFTGKTRLEIKLDEAAFVLANDRAAEAIFKRAPAVVEPALATRATELFSAWRASAERKQLDVDGALLADGLGDPLYQMYFAGWFSSEELGKFLYVVEPDSVEQVTLGQFVPIDLTEKEKRQASKLIHREQRRGRLIGVEIKDLGAWDTWVSASLRGSSAKLTPGGPGFEPQRYVVDLALADKDLEVSGRAQIQLQAQTGLTRIASLELYKDLEVTRVQGASGEALPFRQNAGQVMVVLPRAPAAGETAVVEVFFEGPLFEKIEGGVFLLYETVQWHPHAGEIDRATYDVTFHWPGRLELLAGGKRVDGGEEKGGRRWERRSIDLPAAGLGFEVGKFHLQTRQAGHVAIRLGMMPMSPTQPQGDRGPDPERRRDSITYFEKIFGPYPLDEMTLVADARALLAGPPRLRHPVGPDDGGRPIPVWLIGLEDSRTVVAHEIAHQWWGHQVGWQSYRDQWLSEAMANYASVLYARNKLGGELRYARGPTSGWQASTCSPRPTDGRPVESLGPLVLGSRLISSHGDDAYSSIVYRKGAVVLDMLARRFGEQAFLEMLEKTVEIAGHRAISTELFLEALERLSGVELDGFAKQFIYGTGLPEVYYDYGFAKAEGGKWKITGTARQSAPYRFRYRVVEEGGKLRRPARADRAGAHRGLGAHRAGSRSRSTIRRSRPRKKRRKTRPRRSATACSSATCCSRASRRRSPSSSTTSRRRSGSTAGRRSSAASSTSGGTPSSCSSTRRWTARPRTGATRRSGSPPRRSPPRSSPAPATRTRPGPATSRPRAGCSTAACSSSSPGSTSTAGATARRGRRSPGRGTSCRSASNPGGRARSTSWMRAWPCTRAMPSAPTGCCARGS